MWTILQKPACAVALIVLAVVVLLHGNLGGGFYSIDDNRYIPHSIKGEVSDLFKPKKGIVYAPLTFLTLRMDRALFGPSVEEALNSKEFNEMKVERNPKPSWAWGPRLMNGIYHGLAGILLWFFFSRVGVNPGTALFIAFCWTAHPIALESVAWVCERKNVLCALFGFAALAAWTANPERRWRWPLITFFYTLAMFSKLSALSLLPVLVALELFGPLRTGSLTTPSVWIRLALRLSVILIVSGVFVKLSMGLFEEDIAPPPGGSMWTGLLTDAEIFGRYTLNSLVPFFSSFYYGVEPIVSLASPRFWLCGLALAALWAGMFHFANVNDRRWVMIGFLWFFGALGPNANIIATAFPMQDRYTYLPLPGLLLAFAMTLRGVSMRFPDGERVVKIAAVVYACLVLILAGLRSPLFYDDDRLAYDAIQRQPLSAFAVYMGCDIADRQFKNHLPGASFPNPVLAEQAAQRAILFYEAAEKTHEFWQFATPMRLRTERAEFLLYLKRDREAVELVGPLLKTSEELHSAVDPLRLYPQFPPAFRMRFNLKTERFMMVRAWIAASEGLLLVSFLRDTPPDMRLGLARRAIEHAKRALEFEKKDNPTALLKLGRAQLRVSYLLADENKMDEARRVYAEARETLLKDAIKDQGVPLLKNVPEPEPPKPSKP